MNNDPKQAPEYIKTPEPKRSRLATLLICMGILASALALVVAFIVTRSEPEKKAATELATVVKTVPVTTPEMQIVVDAMGLVVPARSVTVQPEVTGKLVHQSSRLVPGGRFRAGQVLVRIDPRDYDLSVKQQEANVSQARLRLAEEQSKKAVADKEWSLIEGQVRPTEEGRRLARREIQLDTARAQLSAAIANLERAKLARSRTTLRAPFNALVIEEYVDVGQVVSNATRIATLVDSDRFWVRVSVPTDRLRWIRIPGVNSPTGSTVAIFQQLSTGERNRYEGTVARLQGDLDPKGKMARLLIEVDQPLAADMPAPELRDTQTSPTLPLLLGSYVSVEIGGPTLRDIPSVPRTALRDQNQIWVRNPDSKLEIRPVNVVWTQRDRVLVQGEVAAGEEVVVSRIGLAVEGMELRLNGYKDHVEPAPAADSGAPAADPEAPAGEPEAQAEQADGQAAEEASL